MPDRSTTSRQHRRGAAGGWPGQPAQGYDAEPRPWRGAGLETEVGAEPKAEAGMEPKAEAGVALEQLRAELEAAQTQAAEHLASLQRTAADFANFRRRTAEDRERELGLASESLLRKLLTVADDFDRALDTMPGELKGVGWIEGIVLLDRKLRQLLESEGVTPIEAIGRPFDPREHEAIASLPAPGRPDGEVIAEMQRGYRVRDRILRPAMVAVAAGGAAASGDITPHTN
ncbi:MAG: nucleotide exchange factor GrpE [Candidatus Limnocylindrales bacterium]|jgi:molecular chaperone GrpE